MAPKAVFVKFELDVRYPDSTYKPAQGKRAVEDAWAGLDAIARLSVTNRIDTALVAATRVAQQRTIAFAASNAFNTDPAQQASEFWDDYLQTKAEYSFLLILQTRCSDAWKALGTEYQNQGLSAVVRTYIESQRSTAGEIAWINTMIENLDDLKDRAFPVPVDVNGQPKMLEKYLSPRREGCVRENKPRSDANQGIIGNINAPSQWPIGRWEAWKHIGKGGQGSAWIWLYFDQNNTIRSRTVRKDTDYEHHWFNLQAWTGNDVKDYLQRIPWEHQCQSRLTYNATSTHTAKMRIPSTPFLVNNALHIHRLYTEWCPYGDLGDLLDDYRRRPAPRSIPEPMLWAVAEALALAGHAMQWGHEDPLHSVTG